MGLAWDYERNFVQMTYSSNAASNRAKLHSHALVTAFEAHSFAAFIRQTLVPGSPNIDTSRKDRDKAEDSISSSFR